MKILMTSFSLCLSLLGLMLLFKDSLKLAFILRSLLDRPFQTVQEDSLKLKKTKVSIGNINQSKFQRQTLKRTKFKCHKTRNSHHHIDNSSTMMRTKKDPKFQTNQKGHKLNHMHNSIKFKFLKSRKSI